MKNTALFDERQLSRGLNISIATARRWRPLGQGLKFLRVGVLGRYRPEDTDAWQKSRPAVGSAEDSGYQGVAE
jgi:hypothetical protein